MLLELHFTSRRMVCWMAVEGACPLWEGRHHAPQYFPAHVMLVVHGGASEGMVHAPHGPLHGGAVSCHINRVWPFLRTHAKMVRT